MVISFIGSINHLHVIYYVLKSILASNEDIIYTNDQKRNTAVNNTKGYVRGASYYGGHHHDQ